MPSEGRRRKGLRELFYVCAALLKATTKVLWCIKRCWLCDRGGAGVVRSDDEAETCFGEGSERGNLACLELLLLELQKLCHNPAEPLNITLSSSSVHFTLLLAHQPLFLSDALYGPTHTRPPCPSRLVVPPLFVCPPEPSPSHRTGSAHPRTASYCSISHSTEPASFNLGWITHNSHNKSSIKSHTI